MTSRRSRARAVTTKTFVIPRPTACNAPDVTRFTRHRQHRRKHSRAPAVTRSIPATRPRNASTVTSHTVPRPSRARPCARAVTRTRRAPSPEPVIKRARSAMQRPLMLPRNHRRCARAVTRPKPRVHPRGTRRARAATRLTRRDRRRPARAVTPTRRHSATARDSTARRAIVHMARRDHRSRRRARRVTCGPICRASTPSTSTRRARAVTTLTRRSREAIVPRVSRVTRIARTTSRRRAPVGAAIHSVAGRRCRQSPSRLNEAA
jgi:hypothetical protein